MKFSYNRNASAPEVIAIAVISFVVVAAIIGVFAALGALILSWAWNTFMPPVFGLPSITFFQAFALTFLIGSIKGLLSVQIKRKDE